MTLNCCKFTFSRNFTLVGMFERQQRLNEINLTNKDRPALSARGLLRTESAVQRCIDYVDIAARSYMGGRFCELRPIYQGCRALTFALARLSCTLSRHQHLSLYYKNRPVAVWSLIGRLNASRRRSNGMWLLLSNWITRPCSRLGYDSSGPFS